MFEELFDPRPRYYRRDGSPYPSGFNGLIQWAKDFENLSYKIVDSTYTIYGERVSTVWLGLDHAFNGPPLIFETMVFGRKTQPLQLRYTTETQAHRGHVKVWFQSLVPPPLRSLFFEDWY